MHFLQNKPWAYQASSFSSYVSLRHSSSLSFLSFLSLPSAFRKLQQIHVSWRMPFLHPKPAKSSLDPNQPVSADHDFHRIKQIGEDAPKHLYLFPSLTQNLFALDQIFRLKIQIHWIPPCPGRVCCLPEPAVIPWSCLYTRFTSITGRKLWPCLILDLMHFGGPPHLVTEFFVLPGWLFEPCTCGPAGCRQSKPWVYSHEPAVPLYNLIPLIHSLLKEKKKTPSP